MKSQRLGVMDDLLNSLSEMYIVEAFYVTSVFTHFFLSGVPGSPLMGKIDCSSFRHKALVRQMIRVELSAKVLELWILKLLVF